MSLLDEIFPEPVPESTSVDNIAFITVFFGANDAVAPGEPQHVPLDEYKSNLIKIFYLYYIFIYF